MGVSRHHFNYALCLAEKCCNIIPIAYKCAGNVLFAVRDSLSLVILSCIIVVLENLCVLKNRKFVVESFVLGNGITEVRQK